MLITSYTKHIQIMETSKMLVEVRLHGGEALAIAAKPVLLDLFY